MGVGKGNFGENERKKEREGGRERERRERKEGERERERKREREEKRGREKTCQMMHDFVTCLNRFHRLYNSLPLFLSFSFPLSL